MAGYIGYLKYQVKQINGGEVYFRGEKDCFQTTVPSLYRGEEPKIESLTKAYEKLVKEIPKIIKRLQV
jgi:hypothetical protein